MVAVIQGRTKSPLPRRPAAAAGGDAPLTPVTLPQKRTKSYVDEEVTELTTECKLSNSESPLTALAGDVRAASHS